MDSMCVGKNRNVCKDCETLTEDHSPFAAAAAGQAMLEKAPEPPVIREPSPVRQEQQEVK